MQMYPIYFAKNLKYLRESKGLSQSELAHRLRVSRTSIIYMEGSINNPRLEPLIKIAKFFEISLDDLVFTDLKTQSEK